MILKYSFLFPFQPWCRCITTVYNYFVVTNFFWMFVEGCYLHTAIVMTYSTDKLRKWVFLFIGWCKYLVCLKWWYVVPGVKVIKTKAARINFKNPTVVKSDIQTYLCQNNMRSGLVTVVMT